MDLDVKLGQIRLSEDDLSRRQGTTEITSTNQCVTLTGAAQGITQWVWKIVFFNVGVTARSAMYNEHKAIITNHVPRLCTLMFSYSALNYSYLVLHVRASASILYIVQFPTITKSQK